MKRRKRDEESRNPYGETRDEFIEKYKQVEKIAEICWYFGVRPEQMRDELKKLLAWEGTDATDIR